MTERPEVSPPAATPVTGTAPAHRPGPSFPVFAAGIALYGAAGLGFAAIGGWLGLGLVLVLVTAVITGLIAVS